MSETIHLLFSKWGGEVRVNIVNDPVSGNYLGDELREGGALVKVISVEVDFGDEKSPRGHAKVHPAER